jgi:hypothetical protein
MLTIQQVGANLPGLARGEGTGRSSASIPFVYFVYVIPYQTTNLQLGTDWQELDFMSRSLGLVSVCLSSQLKQRCRSQVGNEYIPRLIMFQRLFSSLPEGSKSLPQELHCLGNK